jgi:glucose/arabinose dehydrogenase
MEQSFLACVFADLVYAGLRRKMNQGSLLDFAERHVGLAPARDGSLLVADDVGNVVWRVRGR